jgi:hypothetical protein
MHLVDLKFNLRRLEMASLWVIITGLGALVGDDPREPRSAHTLLLQPVPRGRDVLGVRIQPHETRMRLSANPPDINVEHREIVLPGSEAPAELTNGSFLLPLGEQLEPPALRLSPDIFSTQSATIMKFRGGFLWPIHVQRNFDLGQFSRKITLPLIGAHHIRSRQRVTKNKFVANGVLYRKPLALGEEPVVRVDNIVYQPTLVPPDQTGSLPVVAGEDNYVFWLFNTADGSPREDFDRDFYLLYDWLIDREVPRYVPVIDTQGLFTPPGQCMFSYAIS